MSACSFSALLYKFLPARLVSAGQRAGRENAHAFAVL